MKCILLLLLLPDLVLAETWISGEISKHRSETNMFETNVGYILTAKTDINDYYVKGYYAQAEVEFVTGLSRWDRAIGLRLSNDGAHQLDKTATLEFGKEFRNGWILALTYDAIHIDQRSLGYTEVIDSKWQKSVSLGHEHDYWEDGVGALIGFTDSWKDFDFQIDVGYINHFTEDVRSHFSIVYNWTDNVGVVGEIRDYDKMGYVEYGVGFRYTFD